MNTAVERIVPPRRWQGLPDRPARRSGRGAGAGGAADAAPPGPDDDPAAQAPLHVWVVDDDAVVALYLGELLREEGFVVTTFVDPQRALRAFERDPQGVDVVVTDQRMPGLHGDALARAMLAMRPQLRVILCTGYSDRLDEQHALAIGLAGFFHKPFDAQALLRTVRHGRNR